MISILFIRSLLLTLLVAAPVFGSEFTADSSIAANGQTAESKLFYAGDRWRLEERRPKGEYRVTIFREDRKSLFVLWPDKQRYIIQPLPEKEFKILARRKPGEEVERTELGHEDISGYATIKYRVKYKVRQANAERIIASIEWFSKKLDFVIQSETEDGLSSTKIMNIREGKLDNKLFEIPADYQPLSKKDVFKKSE